MLSEMSAVKKMTEELIGIDDEVDLVDFLRKWLKPEYKDLFQLELEETIKIASSIYRQKEIFNVMKYTMFLLKNKLAKDLNINMYYCELDIIKVIIFYNNILKKLPATSEDNRRNNNKILKARQIFNFYMCLIGNNVCNIARHYAALRELGLTSLDQEYLENDEYRVLHSIIANKIFDTELRTFMERYCAML